jgi:hypothetical protein
MHGIIFVELKKFADQSFGARTWDRLLSDAGLKMRVFVPFQEYPDADAIALVRAASALTGQSADAVLQAFGEFIVPDLLALYGSLLDARWKTLDVIEHTEQTIHAVVRLRNPGARPPELRCERPSLDEVVIHYASARRMCGVAKGIARGLARHFGETVSIEEAACMHTGGRECRISVRRQARRA